MAVVKPQFPKHPLERSMGGRSSAVAWWWMNIDASNAIEAETRGLAIFVRSDGLKKVGKNRKRAGTT
ncbi:MAG: hypothetical protein ABL900_01605, partial [Burkholderiaceae bacterium]